MLELANRLVPRLGGAEKTLHATRAGGPEPVVRPYPDAASEDAALVAAIRSLECPLEEAAILARTNARLTDFEQAAARRAHPVPGRVAARPRRGAAPAAAGSSDPSAPAAEAVRAEALAAGWVERRPDKLGEREQVRQDDLGRLVELAAEFDGDGAAFVADLRERFAPGSDAARGIHLLTFHRAKGLEFEAVFLPRLQEKELPSKQARTDDEIAEERRLLYVGLTRAKRILWLSWFGKRSRFLAELGVAASTARRADRRSGRPMRSACASGGSSARRPTRCRRTSSSTTRCCTRSPPRARGRSASSRRSAASARRSSSATAKKSGVLRAAGRGLTSKQVEHQLRIAALRGRRRRSCASRARARADR